MIANPADGRMYMELMNGQAGQSVDLGALRALTICTRVNDGEENRELLSIQGDREAAAVRIYSGASPRLEALSLTVELYTDAKDSPLTLSVPWQAIGRGPHDVLLRFSGHIVELFVDGVLVDEEWPMGSVQLENAVAQTYEGIEDTRIWNAALTDEELNGFIRDREGLMARESAYLGGEPGSIQYWRPRGFNTGVGDCMPYFDGEVFHIYYLFDRRGHASKWGLGAHQWAHISSKDLKSWMQHPMAVSITEAWEGSICTGSVIAKDGYYYAFYAVRAVDGSPARLTYAVSPDGIQFTKSEKYIDISNRYTLSSVRDPHVFLDAEGLYHMLITTSLVDGDRHEGCLTHLVSKNLVDWQEEPPFIVPGYHDEPECSDYFEWNGWYYLIFSNDGLARYRYSREPLGGWMRPAMDTIDCVQMRVPKTASFAGGRRLAAGFLSEPGRYGGELVIRELLQNPDGSLGLAFPAEVVDRSGPIVAQAAEALSVENLTGFAEQLWGKVEGEYALSFEAVPEQPTMFYGFSVASGADFKQGYDIRFEPSNRKLGIHETHCVGFREDEASSIYHVEGLEGRVFVEAIVKKGFIDLCVNGKRTIIARINGEHAYLRFFSQFGRACFYNIRISQLSE
ncbi:glycosyl hydrolase [Paenibacillus mendelii]|uniref:beta-fructofuranosidase n=1 Tax=Paenibacillus mendelii TaxID=206163 RepID=A0ABV6J6H3_9BACL|nr:glycosyl hydrolase [Paenibacillus mendelii]MCQ6561146.1 glycosyl hydrolase [Paenibacillus mendelii]